MTEENKKEEKAGGAPPAAGEETQDWEKKAQEYLDGWQRAKADYINREKTIAQEKGILRDIIEEATLLEFLPVLDNLKNALSCVGEEEKKNSWLQGVEHVKKQFEDILKEFGVQAADVMGKEFDPATSEAVEKQGEGNKVIKVLVDGYKKGDKVIRAARVIIG